MAEYTDTVPVLRGHLEEILVALQAAYGKSVSEDMARRYAQMDTGQHRDSRLTGVLESTVERVQGYLHENDDHTAGTK